MPQLGQILVSVLVLSLLGVVLVIQPGSTYIPALLTLAGGITGFWFGGQMTKAGATSTNGTLEKLLTLVQQQNTQASNTVPVEAVTKIAQATGTGATGPQGPQGPQGPVGPAAPAIAPGA